MIARAAIMNPYLIIAADTKRARLLAYNAEPKAERGTHLIEETDLFNSERYDETVFAARVIDEVHRLARALAVRDIVIIAHPAMLDGMRAERDLRKEGY